MTDYDLQPHQVIAGRFEVLQHIGRGASGTVYEARDLLLAELRVALKIFPRLVDSDPVTKARIARELRTALRIDHDNVVRIYEPIRDGNIFGYAMEFVPGISLRDHITRQAPLPLAEVCAIMRQTCHGVDMIHRAGIVHRDIKPENILLSNEGIAKVADFGIARETRRILAVDRVYVGELLGKSQQSITAEGEIAGTLEYLAPEYLAYGDCDARADVYALGVVAYELLSGSLPFQSSDMQEIVLEKLERDFVPLSSKRSDCPAVLEKILAMALAREPRERFQSAKALAAALSAAEEHLMQSDKSTEQPVISRGRKVRRPIRFRIARAWDHILYVLALYSPLQTFSTWFTRKFRILIDFIAPHALALRLAVAFVLFAGLATSLYLLYSSAQDGKFDDRLRGTWLGRLLGIEDQAHAQESGRLLYVSARPDQRPSGDSKPGSMSNPFGTLDAASAVVEAGDTIVLRGGVYIHDRQDCTGNACTFWRLARSGTKDKPIRIRAARGEHVVLKGTWDPAAASSPHLTAEHEADSLFGSPEVLLHLAGNYLEVSGLEISNSKGFGLVVDGHSQVIESVSVSNNRLNGIVVRASAEGGDGMTVLREINASYTCLGAGISLSGAGAAEGLRLLVEDSISFRNGFCGGDQQIPDSSALASGFEIKGRAPIANEPSATQGLSVLLRRNVSYENRGPGFLIAKPRIRLESSASIENGGNGISLDQGADEGEVVGNIIYKNSGTGISKCECPETLVAHNSLYANNTNELPGLDTVRAENNLLIGTSPLEASQSAFGSNMLIAPWPALTMLNLELHLSEHQTVAAKVAHVLKQLQSAFRPPHNSACVDAGISLFLTDPIAGKSSARAFLGLRPDIGAVEQ